MAGWLDDWPATQGMNAVVATNPILQDSNGWQRVNECHVMSESMNEWYGMNKK